MQTKFIVEGDGQNFCEPYRFVSQKAQSSRVIASTPGKFCRPGVRAIGWLDPRANSLQIHVRSATTGGVSVVT